MKKKGDRNAFSNQAFWDSYAEKYDRFADKKMSDSYEKLFKKILSDMEDPHTLLEVGTGTGIIACGLSSEIPVITAIDISPEMIRIAKEKSADRSINNVSFSRGDACHLEFNDESFDLVIASNILHLLSSPEIALKEMKRVLKKGRYVIIPTYCHGESLKARIISRLMGLSGFSVGNRWSSASFLNFIEHCGFRIIKNDCLGGAIPLIYAVAKKE